MKNLKTQLTVLLLSTLWLLTGAYAQITPSADAYTNTATPNMKYGAAPLLDVEGESQTTYIQFDLASIPSGYTSADIAKATLKLYVNPVTTTGSFTAGSFQVNLVSSPWSESTIDANPAPALGNIIASASDVALTAANKNQYILVDVTSALGDWLNGTQPNYGIALVGNTPINVSFDSKENATTSHPPELDIVFASGSGTLTGVTTESGSGLTGGGTTGNLNLGLTTSCAANQILQWSGSAWVCATLSGGGGGITGSGTAGSLPVFNGLTSLAGSNVFQNGSNIGIGTQTPGATLDVNGAVNVSATGSFNIGEAPFAFGSLNGYSAFLGFAGNGSNSSTGGANTASGNQALYSDTTGSFNTAAGQDALFFNTTGNGNTAAGVNSLDANTTGGGNTATGNNSLLPNTTGNYNTAIGYYAGQTIDSSNVTASNNTALGSGAAFSTGTLTNATAIGSNAEVSGSNSIVLGSIAGYNKATASTYVGIGTTTPGATLDVEAPVLAAPLVTTPPTVTFGNASNPATFTVNGTANFNGTVNFALNGFGTAVSGSNASTISGPGANGGGFTTASPGGSGIVGTDSSTSGGYGGFFSSASTAGSGIWASNTTGGLAGYFTGPVAVIGYETVGGNLTASGVVTGSSFQIGSTLFDYGSPASNDAFLGFAGNGTNPGTGNTASGWLALAADTTGGSNVASGFNSLNNNTAGSFNTALGVFAGQTADGSPMTTNNNTFLGAGAEAATGGINNATAIGSNSLVGASDSLVLGGIAGFNNAILNTKVGIGTTTPGATLDVEAPSGSAPTVIFGNVNSKATLTVTGTANIVGSLTLNGQVITGAGGGISSVTAGSGISATTSSGNVTVANTGVISITNGHGISSLGMGGQNPVINIDTTAVPLLSTSNTFSGSLIANTGIPGAPMRCRASTRPPLVIRTEGIFLRAALELLA
jgi:hypothetical protein